MHPYVKLHKPLRLVPLLLIICMMILCPVRSENCNVRAIQMYSQFTGGHVRIDGRKVVASTGNSVNYMNHILQTVTIDWHHFVIYDPNAKMFLCWNRSFTNLTPKRNPRSLDMCKFEEKVSIRRPMVWTRYTTSYPGVNNQEREVELRFNKAGNFARPLLIRRCLEKKKKVLRTRDLRPPKIDVDFIMKLDTLNITAKSQKMPKSRHPYAEKAKHAYIQLSKYCADADFLVQKCPLPLNSDFCDCRNTTYNFCKQMYIIHQRHHIAKELSDFCQNDWKKNNY